MNSCIKPTYLLIFMLGLLTACSSTPPKKSSNSINKSSSLYQELEKTRLPKRLPIPVEGISRGQLVDTWGNARSQGRSHEGIDILAKKGTPVLSATDGFISKVTSYGAGGNAITIVGYALSQHYYAHLDRFGSFKVGDPVKVGDVLGYVGSTGNASTPHLHYGIYLYPNRVATNPYSYLR